MELYFQPINEFGKTHIMENTIELTGKSKKFLLQSFMTRKIQFLLIYKKEIKFFIFGRCDFWLIHVSSFANNFLCQSITVIYLQN